MEVKILGTGRGLTSSSVRPARAMKAIVVKKEDRDFNSSCPTSILLT
jgi:hypothetical protein